MRTNQALFFSGVVLAGVAGLALSEDKSSPQGARSRLTSPHDSQPPAPGKSVKAAAADFPVICYIEQRDRTITVKAGPKGPVYSVKAGERKSPLRQPFDRTTQRAGAEAGRVPQNCGGWRSGRQSRRAASHQPRCDCAGPPRTLRTSVVWENPERANPLSGAAQACLAEISSIR